MELTSIALWLNTAFQVFDEAAAIFVHRLFDLAGWFFTPFFNLISLLGKWGLFLMVLSAALILFPRSRKFGTAMLLALGIGALITNVAVKPLVLRPRPYTFENSVYYRFWLQLGCKTESDFSFPSGHTTAAMAAAFAAFIVGNKKKFWPVLIFPVLMAFSRIYLSVHYCTDVIGGMIVGAIGAVLASLIVKLIPSRYYQAVFFKSKRMGSSPETDES